MSLLQKLFGAEDTAFFEVSRPKGDGTCSDNECPCGFPGATIAPGTGYLYISAEVVEFRQDARTEAEVREKFGEEGRRLGRNKLFVIDANASASPVLMCEMGARRRNIDLAVASNDAKHWWQTGQVPLRPTPKVKP